MYIDQYVSNFFVRLFSNIWDAFKNPKHVGKKWYPHTSVLIFMFWISYIVKLAYLFIKKHATDDETIKFIPITYSWFVNLIILFSVFLVDFNKRCEENNMAGKSIIEGVLVVIPLYLTCIILFKFRYWRLAKREMKETLPVVGEFIYGLLEGGVIYGFFNVAMNFRTKYKYTNCDEIITGEKEIREFKDQEIKRTKKLSHNIVFEGDYTWADPTVVNQTTKTVIKQTKDPINYE